MAQSCIKIFKLVEVILARRIFMFQHEELYLCSSEGLSASGDLTNTIYKRMCLLAWGSVNTRMY